MAFFLFARHNALMEELFIPSSRKPYELKARIYTAGREKPWLVVTHGIGEHQGRHSHWIELCQGKLNLCTYDLLGHGESHGRRGWIDKFSQFAADLAQVIQYLREEKKMTSHYLHGHSMGALIVSEYIQKKFYEDLPPEKIHLNAPPVGVGGPVAPLANNLSLKAIKNILKLPLGFPLPGLVDKSALSHDPKVKRNFEKDQLAITPCLKLIFELLKTSKSIYNRPLSPPCPALVTIGEKDNIVHPARLIQYFQKTEKYFELWKLPRSFHEIHNEIEEYQAPYFDKIKTFLEI